MYVCFEYNNYIHSQALNASTNPRSSLSGTLANWPNRRMSKFDAGKIDGRPCAH